MEEGLIHRDNVARSSSRDSVESVEIIAAPGGIMSDEDLPSTLDDVLRVAKDLAEKRKKKHQDVYLKGVRRLP